MNKVFFLIMWFIHHKNIIYICYFRHFSTIFWERKNLKDEIIEETTPNINTTQTNLIKVRFKYTDPQQQGDPQIYAQVAKVLSL